MPKGDVRLPLESLAVSDGERHAEFKRRRDQFVYMKVPTGGEAPYLAEGWTIEKKLKRQLRLSKLKSLDRQFEDRIWRLFYRMGYDELNKGHGFTIQYKATDGSFREKQVDIFAKDAETVIVGECKCCEDYKQRSLSKDIAEFIGLRKQFADAIRAHYGRDGQKIPELKNVRVPAIRGKLGGRTFYSFVSTPEQLLKICFVNHRTLADPLALPTYQRLVKRSRLKAIGEFIKSDGFFPTNILINFDEKRRFDKKETDGMADVQVGDLHMPDKYKSAWIVDGQHRLYGYSLIDPKYSKQNVAVIAFEELRREEEANLFVTINHEQKSVPRTLLDELDADLKWGSSVPAERLASISARIVQALTETVGGPLFRRVVAQGMKVDDSACLTMPEVKGGVIRSHLVGRLAQKRKLAIEGPLSADTDERTVKRATKAINLFLTQFKMANLSRWELGRRGALCVNTGIRALLLLFDALIKHAAENKKGFDPANVKPEEIVDEVTEICKPVIEFIRSSPDDKFVEQFGAKYGSGGPVEYFHELSQIIWSKNSAFKPEGLEEYLNSKDDKAC
jgi:DNA sulfur modification protein DndB